MPSQKKRSNYGKILKHRWFLPVTISTFLIALLIIPLMVPMSLPTRDTDYQGMISISNINFGPTDPESHESVTVTCSVSTQDELDSIDTVKLLYGNQIFDEYRVTMSGSSTFTGVIPAQSDGTTVTFLVEVTTLRGDSVVSDHHFYTVNDPLPPPPPPPPPPEENVTVSYEFLAFDPNGNSIEAIHTAIINGTVRFDVNIFEGESIVAFVKLKITGRDEIASPGGTWYFEKISDTEYTLDFDTTVMNDGEYLFEFSVILFEITDGATGGTGIDAGYFDLPMSSFLLYQSDEGGLLGILLNYSVEIVILICVVIVVAILYYYFTQHDRKTGRGRKV